MSYVYLYGGAIGDALVGIHLARSLAARKPGARLTLLSTRRNPFVRELAESLPFVRYRECVKGDPRTWWLVFALVASRPSTFVFEPTDVPLPSWWRFLLSAARLFPGGIEAHNQVVGHERPLRTGARMILVMPEDNLFTVNVPRILDAWGLPEGEMPLPSLPRVAGSATAPYFVFHFFAGNYRRSWPFEKVRPFLKAARAAFPEHAFILTSLAQERAKAEEMMEGIPNARVAAGLPATELMQLLSSAELVVGVASGITHISSHLGIGTVALANLSDPYWLPTYAPKTQVLANREECRCLGNKEGDCSVAIEGGIVYRCLYYISSERIIEAMQRSLPELPETPVRLFYPQPLVGLEVHPSFHYRHPPKEKGGGLFRDIDYRFFRDAETPEITEASAVVLVHNFAKQPNAEGQVYIQEHLEHAEEYGIPLFLLSCSDFSDTITFDSRAFVFRQSLYRDTVGPRDISLPTTTEDPPPDLLFVREKEERPMVAFCGMGGFSKRTQWLKYFVRNALADLHSLLEPFVIPRKIGVYWRRAMMRACERSGLVKTNFIVRSSFSGHIKSIELDPARARREYLETSANADFVLAPKGDGNYSNRFLKTLAFGRVPVLVDTDVVLPLEGTIPYEKIIVRVPMKDVGKTAAYIRSFYDALSPEEWKVRQALAREIFTTYLAQEKFFEFFFTHQLPRAGR